MAITIDKRLQILEEGGVITSEVRTEVEWAVQAIEAQTGRSLDTNTGEMLVTHLAMMFDRAVKGEVIAEVPDEVVAEVQGRPEALALSRQLIQKIKGRLNVQVPENEVYLVAAYLAALDEEK